MHIHISNYAIAPFGLASFVILLYQYYRINPDRRIFNLHFALMVTAIALSLADVFFPAWSIVYCVLALSLLGLTLFLNRTLPPPRN
jgi:hypothetical protein